MESNDKLEQLLEQMYAQESLHDDDIDTSDIIDEEWTKFEAEHFGNDQRSNSSLFTLHSSLTKIAASFIGLLMLSGFAYATIHLINNSKQKPQDVQTVTVSNSQSSTLNAQLAEPDSTDMKPIIYEDTELATILSDIATFYQVEPVYKKADSKHIRLYFTWDKKQTIDDLIDTFNKFERIHITREHQKLIVE